MRIVVAGTGYVGLVTGACLSEIGHNVTCVDIDENKVTMMKEGISPIYEPGLDELLKKNHDEGRLNFTTDYKNAYKNAEIVFIGVGTPEREDGSANLDYVFTVCKEIAENIENDHWVHAERRKDEDKHQMDECAAHLEYGVFYFICDLHIRLEQLGREKFILGNVHERDPFLNAGFGSEPKHLRVTVCSNIIFGKIKKCSRHKSTKSSAYIIGR